MVVTSDDRVPIINSEEEISVNASSSTSNTEDEFSRGELSDSKESSNEGKAATSDKDGVPKQASIESSGAPDMQVYGRRWYILILFSALACHQCLVWNTWGPIASSVQKAYDWTDGEVAMMANWGTITFVLSALPLSWLIEKHGLRPTCVLISGMIALGTALRLCRRIFPTNGKLFLVASHLCAILNGITGVTVMSSPPIISSVWFPQHERTTATAINQAGNMLGNGLSMLIGPALVAVNSTSGHNSSSFLSSFLRPALQFGDLGADQHSVEDLKDDIDTYMLLQFLVALVLFCCFLVYYPSRPPLPPSPTSAIVRTNYLRGIYDVISNKEILLSCFAYSVSQGIVGVWMSVMVLNLRSLGISDQDVGYIGLVSVVGSCVASLVVGFCMDRFKHKIKLTLIWVLVLVSLLFLLLMLMCVHVIHVNSTFMVAVAIVLATSLAGACCPLFFELSVEIAYPVSENVVAVFLTTGNNFVGMLFLFIFFIPNIGSTWINYVLIASSVCAVPAVALIKERYNRSTVDELVTGVI